MIVSLELIEEDCKNNPARAEKIWKTVQENLTTGQLTTGDYALDFSAAIMNIGEYKKLHALLGPFTARLSASVGKPAVLVHVIEQRTSTAEPGMHYLLPPPDHIKLTYIFTISMIEKIVIRPKNRDILLSRSGVECWNIPSEHTDLNKKTELSFPIRGVRMAEDEDGVCDKDKLEIFFGLPPDSSDISSRCSHIFYGLVDTAEICSFPRRQRREYFMASGSLDDKKYVLAMRSAFARLGFLFPAEEWLPHLPAAKSLVDQAAARLPELQAKIPTLRNLGPGYSTELAPYISTARDLISRMEGMKIGDLPVADSLRKLLEEKK